MTHWSERHMIVPAVYILLERDDKVLLLRRAHTGYMNGYYTPPAGHMDGGEAPSTAMVREAMEEVGVTVKPEDLELAHCMMYMAAEGTHERVTLFFKTKHFEGEPKNMEPNKCDDVSWFSKDELPEMVWEAKHAFEQIAAGNVYSEVY
jgi:8-oxo-dGTP diphosphatase